MNPRSVMAANARKSRTTFLRAAYYFFLTSGVVALLYVGYVFVDAYHYQAREQTAFELPQVKNVSQREGPRLIAEGGVIGELAVPRLGLKVIVAQGDSPRILQRSVGHIRETALPGESGNVALTGHRDTFFRTLRNIRSGDAITFKTAAGDFRYQVESTTVVPPSDVSVLQPSSEPTITLITCFPFYYVGAAPNRFIVRARQVSVLPDQFGQH